MTANDTVSSSSPPSGLVPISLLRPVLQSLMLAHTLSTLLIPLFFALLYYSTPHSRRQPIFFLNVLAIAMVFSIGVLAVFTGIHFILSPQEALSPMVWVASGVMGIFVSMLVDLILLFRLVSVYPLSQVGPRRFAIITILPILLKVVRVINVVVFIKIVFDLVKKLGMEALYTYFGLPYLKIEWVTQVVDNTYVSIMFLRAIYGRGKSSEMFSRSSVPVRPRFADRLRSLFRIALSNFVVPTLFSIVQLIIIFVLGAGGGPIVGDVIFTNGMVSVYGVVFASVWAGKESRRKLEEKVQQPSSSEDRGENRPAQDALELGMWSDASRGTKQSTE